MSSVISVERTDPTVDPDVDSKPRQLITVRNSLCNKTTTTPHRIYIIILNDAHQNLFMLTN